MLNPTALIAGALACVVGGFFAGSTYTGRGWEARWNDRERVIQAALAERAEENRRIEAQAASLLRQAQDEHDRKIEELRVAHRRALDRLRDDSRRAALKPAETAPAECRDHAAPPSQLSGKDAEFLVDFAAEADRLAEQLAQAQRYIESINKAMEQ